MVEDLYTAGAAISLLLFGNYLGGLSGDVFFGGAAYCVLGASFYYSSNHLSKVSATSSTYIPVSSRAKAMALIIVCTAICAEFSRRVDGPAVSVPVFAVQDVTSAAGEDGSSARVTPVGNACRIIAQLSGSKYAAVYVNGTYKEDPGASVACHPTKCACLDGIARKPGRPKCQLYRKFDRPLDSTKAGLYIAEYHFRCGMEGRGWGIIMSKPVSRVVEVRQPPVLKLQHVGERYSEVQVAFTSRVNRGISSLRHDVLAVENIAPESFTAYLLDQYGKVTSGAIAILDVRAKEPQHNSSLSDAIKQAPHVYYLRLGSLDSNQSLEWPVNGTLAISPTRSDCRDALPPFAPCLDTTIHIPLRNPPAVGISLIHRQNSNTLVAQLEFTEPVGSQAIRNSLPSALHPRSLRVLVSSERKGMFWGTTVTQKELEIMDIRRVPGSNKYLVSLPLAEDTIENADKLIMKINEDKSSGSIIVAHAYPRLDVPPTTWELEFDKGHCCPQEPWHSSAVDHPSLCRSPDEFYSNSDACPLPIDYLNTTEIVHAPPHAPRLRLRGPALLTIYQNEAYEDAGAYVVSHRNKIAAAGSHNITVKFDRPLDLTRAVSGMYLQTYSIQETPTVKGTAVIRVVHVRGSRPAPVIVGWHMKSETGNRTTALVLLTKFTSPITGLAHVGVSVKVGNGNTDLIPSQITLDAPSQIWHIEVDLPASHSTDVEDNSSPFTRALSRTVIMKIDPASCKDAETPFGQCALDLLKFDVGPQAILDTVWGNDTLTVSLQTPSQMEAVDGGSVDTRLFEASWAPGIATGPGLSSCASFKSNKLTITRVQEDQSSYANGTLWQVTIDVSNSAEMMRIPQCPGVVILRLQPYALLHGPSKSIIPDWRATIPDKRPFAARITQPNERSIILPTFPLSPDLSTAFEHVRNAVRRMVRSSLAIGILLAYGSSLAYRTLALVALTCGGLCGLCSFAWG
ncbi:hypothetical protein DFJ77DRAFT_474042 [Powellomyces hirtus]|nr:hypothetical protein DFJ77DRAFT_474042 [Powellomyces hirtus]